MRNQTESIDDKIKQLQNKKKALEIKQALTFVRALKKALTEDVDLQTILGLVDSEWSHASSAIKEAWQQRGAQFCDRKSSPNSQTASPKQSNAQQIHREEISHE